MSREKLRICLLSPMHWAAAMGGAEMQMKMLVERLTTASSYDVHYVAREVDPAFRPTGYSIHKIPSRRSICGTYPLDVPGLLRLLDQLRPDVIYQRVACTYTGAAAYFARTRSCRMIWHVANDIDLMPLPWRLSLRSPIEKLDRWFVDYGARHAHTVIVQNAQQAELLHKHYARTDAIHIPNFHRPPTTTIQKDDGRITVCWVGNIKKVKHPEVFLRLALDFRERSDVEFIMVGAQHMYGKNWDIFDRSQRTVPNLRYLGVQSQAAVDELLSTAHVLVNTSEVEGFPNTFIQAWLREAAVISLTVNPDGVFDQDRYGICATGSYENLHKALDQLITDASLRHELALRARAFALERFSERNIERIIDLFPRDR